jgi:hypothetical protein
MMALHRFVGRNSAVGIATRYGLDGPGVGVPIFFRTRPGWLWGPSSLLNNGYQDSEGVKRPRRGFDHTLSGAKVKERAQLHIYSRSGTPRPLLG